MENLSLKAAKMAEADIVQLDPRLADRQFRVQRRPEEKQAIFSWLLAKATWYEHLLINKLI